MNDPKMQGAQILKDTGCRIGAHQFAWTSSAAFQNGIPPGLICSCGRYSFDEVTKIRKNENDPHPA